MNDRRDRKKGDSIIYEIASSFVIPYVRLLELLSDVILVAFAAVAGNHLADEA